MKDLDYYRSLPDSLSTQRLEFEFSRLLDEGVAGGDSGLVEAVFELSERQWESYSLLDDGIRNRASEKLVTLWDDQSVDRAETLLAIAARLGLRAVLELARMRQGSASAAVANCVHEALEEFGESVDDPYSGVGRMAPTRVDSLDDK